MSKYSNSFKLEVVNYYLINSITYKETAEHFNMPESTSIHKWVNKYKKHGKHALTAVSKNYSGKFKHYVIEYMRANHLSFCETARLFNIGCHDSISRWNRIYKEKGPQALYTGLLDNNENMRYKPNKDKSLKEKEIDLKVEN